MRRHKGSIDNRLTWVIAAVVAAVAIGALAQSGALGEAGIYLAAAVAVAGVGWIAWATGALPFVDAGMRAALAARMAKRLKGTVSSFEERIWGGETALAYAVEWEGRQRRYRLDFDVTGLSLSAPAPGAARAEAIISVRGGQFECQGEGKALAERLLDDSMRAALASIDRLRPGGLSLHLAGGQVRIYKQQRLSASRTHQLVLLGMPVIERAIALMREH